MLSFFILPVFFFFFSSLSSLTGSFIQKENLTFCRESSFSFKCVSDSAFAPSASLEILTSLEISSGLSPQQLPRPTRQQAQGLTCSERKPPRDPDMKQGVLCGEVCFNWISCAGGPPSTQLARPEKCVCMCVRACGGR